MKNKKGFTLIEVLVVVLIIGILAAIAVPQYKKSVEKSRAAQMFTAVKSISDANRLYYLQNGFYTQNFEDLDIDFANASGHTLNINDFYSCILGDSGYSDYVYCIMNTPLISLQKNYKTNILRCNSYNKDNYKGDSLCQLLTGTTNYSSGCGNTNTCHIYQMQ